MFRTFCVIVVFLIPNFATAGSSCPSNFEEYLSVFQQDPSFRIEHTRFPLSYSYLDSSASPEPKTIMQTLSKEQAGTAKGVQYPDRKAEKTTPLQRKVKKAGPDGYLVDFNKPDTDYLIEFKFVEHERCWQLVAVNDFSL